MLGFLSLMVLLKLGLSKFIDNKNLNFILVVLGILSIIFPFISNIINTHVPLLFQTHIIDIYFVSGTLFSAACYQLYLMINNPEIDSESVMSTKLFLCLGVLSFNIVWVKIIFCIYYLISKYIKNNRKKVIVSLEVPFILLTAVIILNESNQYDNVLLTLLIVILFIQTIFSKVNINKAFMLVVLSSCAAKFTSDNTVVVTLITILAGVLSLFYILDIDHQKNIQRRIKSNKLIMRIIINLISKINKNYKINYEKIEKTPVFKSKKNIGNVGYFQSDHLINSVLISLLTFIALIAGVAI
jgi:hypothetical protein